jgi:hypothetical protein
VDDRASRRAAAIASIALLLFSALTAFVLVAWFRHNPAPWNWKSALAVVCASVAVATSALVWRTPSRLLAIVGIGVMLASLARVGLPAHWTWVSFALVAATLVLLMPLVHAAIVLRSD